MQHRETLSEADLRFVENGIVEGTIILQDVVNGNLELWQLNDDFAGAVVIWGDHAYEFLRTIRMGA